uniref:Uncharacterized protein n=1 Tax=Periophthalmus magnuspinnatus TaxID=409849 RepID=A0A3B3ZSC7_9GOBI
MKSPLPHLDLKSGQQCDINTLLSLVEDIIKQHNRPSEDFYNDTVKKDMWEDSDKSSNSAQKNTTSYNRYLYRQLCHVEKELGLLGPSRFPSSNNYNRALQQVHGMKSLLDQTLAPAEAEPQAAHDHRHTAARLD